jgi:hypothetical protein
MPHSGARKARGLTAKALTERSSLPRCASSSDSVFTFKEGRMLVASTSAGGFGVQR